MTFGICFKQHFDTRYLVFYNPSPPGCFCPWTFFQNIGFNMVPSDPFMLHLASQLGYSAGEFQAFATDCPCDVSWLNHLPHACWSIFWKSNFKHPLGCRFDILDSISSLFCILTYAIISLDTSYNFWLYLYLFNILYFFKYSCTNNFHRHGLCTFYCTLTPELRFNQKSVMLPLIEINAF